MNRSLLVLSLCFFSAATALAQPNPSGAGAAGQKPAAQNDPNFKSTPFGDWTLHCQTIGTAPQARKSCEVVQTVNIKDQTAPFAQIAVGKPAPTEPAMVTVVVPINVSFPSSVQVQTNEKDNSPLDLTWKRCIPGGCFASVVLKDDALKKWRALNDASGRVHFKNALSQDVVMPMSFKGLAQALDALAKE
jgi:invasion protein IalB